MSSIKKKKNLFFDSIIYSLTISKDYSIIIFYFILICFININVNIDLVFFASEENAK